MAKIFLTKIDIPPLGLHLIVEVTINGIQTNFVLDTGASRSVIDLNYLNEIVSEAELHEESSQSAGIGGSELKSYTTDLKNFKVGDFETDSYEIAVMDLTHVKASYEQIGEEPIYGVIGSDLLFDKKAVINYNTLTLELSE